MSRRDREVSAAYANAVFETALEDWLTGLKAVQDVLGRDESVVSFLTDGTVDLAQRQDKARELMPEGASEELFNFVSLLMSKNHLHLLGDVIEDLEMLARKGTGLRAARVTTAAPLAEKERERIENAVTDRFGRDLEFEFLVDESILGGLIVRVGDEVMDDSIASKLAVLKESVLATE